MGSGFSNQCFCCDIWCLFGIILQCYRFSDFKRWVYCNFAITLSILQTCIISGWTLSDFFLLVFMWKVQKLWCIHFTALLHIWNHYRIGICYFLLEIWFEWIVCALCNICFPGSNWFIIEYKIQTNFKSSSACIFCFVFYWTVFSSNNGFILWCMYRCSCRFFHA